MTDIVGRLGDDAKLERNHESPALIMREAAAEIERLTEALQDCQSRAFQERHELNAEIGRLRAVKTPASAELLNIAKAALEHAEAEVGRLRAALESISDLTAFYEAWADIARNVLTAASCLPHQEREP
jgi:hypothetical protein